MKNLIKKYFLWSQKRQRRKIWQEVDDKDFLKELCIEYNHGRVLNLNKYSRLMSMVKRKYKK